MTFSTFIDAAALAKHLDDAGWVVVDCRFSLKDTEAGRAAWKAGTIAGSVYAHLDEDLSSPIVAGKTGRHPLPTVEDFAAKLGAWGIGNDTQVVAFDDMGGAFAARLWWMLRWLGHDAVAVLDGGLPAWTAAGHGLQPGVAPTGGATFVPMPRPELLVDAAGVLASLDDASVQVIDARAASRYAGDEEPTDPVAGHIAGAVNAPWPDNLGAEQTMREPDELRARFTEVLDGRDPAKAICYCGSGVTACHDILAMVHVGMPMPRLYAGSWSDWITDPSRPRIPQ